MNKNPALKPARVGRLYDVNHAAAQTWLAGRGFDLDDITDAAVVAPRPVKAVEAELGDDKAEVPLDSVASLTLAELTEQFGTSHEMLVWVKIRKELAAARRQEHLMARVQGQLIPKELVQRLFSYLDALGVRLLTDTSVTLATRVLNLARAGAKREEALSLVRELISTQLENAQAGMLRTLANPDTSAPLKDSIAPQREDPIVSGGRRALKALEPLLRNQAAPVIVDMVTKWNTHTPAQSAEESARTVGNILCAHLNTAVLALSASSFRAPKENQS
ncbi:MAG: hypothetical protein ABI488_23565 [Polyangiaceae bacterium]